MRRFALIGLALVVLVLPASAGAHIPSKQDRLDAKRFARDWWASRNWRYGDGSPACYGVRFRWRSWRYDPSIRGTLARVPVAHDCIIVFNKNVTWGRVPLNDRGTGEVQYLKDDWWRLCATAIHEWGHLRGMPYNWRNPPVHSNNGNNIMAYAEALNTRAWWWPAYPGCRYEGDDFE
jgi:hypothetical protein